MSVFNIFKREKKQDIEVYADIEELYENGYPFQQRDIVEHASLYSTLGNNQRGVILVTMEMFAKSFIPVDTEWRDFSKGLLKIKSEILGISPDDAWNYVQSPDDVNKLLSSIENRRILDILLSDMKFLLKIVVNSSLRNRNGAEVNRNAINALYGIFIPLGYSQLEIFNPKQFMMF